MDEGVGDLGRVGRVADGVAPAQQHLERDVGHGLAQQGEPLPRVLAEEAQGHVVGRPTPGLHRQQLGREPRDVAGDVEQVAGAHAGREQRLVGVAEGRVGHGDVGALAQPAGELGRPDALEQVARAGGHRGVEVEGGQLGARPDARCGPDRAAG